VLAESGAPGVVINNAGQMFSSIAGRLSALFFGVYHA
jgi:hypothetical protein